MAKAKTFARGILFKLIIDSTFHGISLQRLKIVDEARLKQACFGKKAAEWEQHKAHMDAGSLAPMSAVKTATHVATHTLSCLQT